MDGCQHHKSRFTVSGDIKAMKGSYFDRECVDCEHNTSKVCDKCKINVHDKFKRRRA